jgi:hypothetical protein
MSERILTEPSRWANEESALLLSTKDGLTKMWKGMESTEKYGSRGVELEGQGLTLKCYPGYVN